MHVTMREVAVHAGVSLKTVSNVVNGYHHVSSQTRDRVQRSIDALGYRANLSARHLKYGRGGFLSFALPDLEWPYFTRLAARFTEAAEQIGYIALLEQTGGEHLRELRVLSGQSTHMIDGVLFSTLMLSHHDLAGRRDRTPMVLVGEVDAPATYDHVAVDSLLAARRSTEHLLRLGRSRVAAIGWNPASGTAKARIAGYRRALSDAGMPDRPEHVGHVRTDDRESGYSLMRGYLASSNPPDAVFCCHDLLAIGAIRACHEAGVKVPDDIAVSGFDDIDEGRYSTPTLTTISPDIDFLVNAVLRLLLDQIEGRQAREPERISVPWTLVERESTTGRRAPAQPSIS